MTLQTNITTAPMLGSAIEAILPQRFPFVFLDKIVAWEPLQWARGAKGIAAQEPFLLAPDAKYWPMPFVIESLGQLAIGLFNLSQNTEPAPKVLLGTVSGVTYHQPIPLGCCLDLEVQIERFIENQFIVSGVASVDGALCMTIETLVCKLISSGAEL